MDQQYMDLLPQALAAVIGGVVTLIFTKLRNKTACFSFHWVSNRIALSANDSAFGDVRATWQNVQVRNLHLFTFEIENTTTTDFENVDFRVYSAEETRILNEKTELVDTPYIIEWANNYRSRQAVGPGQQPTQQQLDEHHHNREYTVTVFNRGQKVRLSYLCTRPNDDEPPMLFLATPSKGVRLKQVAAPTITLNPILGVPIPAALTRGLIVCLVVVLASSYFIPSVPLAASICMIVGLVGQVFGALVYRAETLIRKLVAG